MGSNTPSDRPVFGYGSEVMAGGRGHALFGGCEDRQISAAALKAPPRRSLRRLGLAPDPVTQFRRSRHDLVRVHLTIVPRRTRGSPRSSARTHERRCLAGIPWGTLTVDVRLTWPRRLVLADAAAPSVRASVSETVIVP